jgi:3-mercaptopyruvate sulfurtransferase SseA
MRQQENEKGSCRRVMGRKAALGLFVGMIVLLAGCSGGQDTSGGGTGVTITSNTPAAIAIESDADYNNNTYGLITGTTLKTWLTDWNTNRPAGITGKLIILQATAGEVDPAVPSTYNYAYIKPNNFNVFTFLSPSSEWTMTRSNGVITTPSMVIDGPTIDANFKKYNIDPQNDMIVCAQGTASSGNVMSMGRCWFALRYWGVDAKHISVLNGGNKWQADSAAMVAGDFAASASTAPNTGTASVKQIPVDNTMLQATVEELLAVLPSSDINVKTDGVFVWDARTISQYSAGEMFELNDSMQTTPASTCLNPYCAPPAGSNYMKTFQNSGSRQGHPWGVLQLNFNDLLDAAQGYSFIPKAQIVSYLNGDVDAAGRGFTDATYQLVGSGNAYQPGDTIYVYCETTFRAMITGMASAVILGKPTRFYDGGMIEWNSLSHLQDATGNYILPIDSPWRTDVKSFFREPTSISTVATRTINDPYALHANKIIKEDMSYKTGVTAGTGGSGGGSAPPNPCG